MCEMANKCLSLVATATTQVIGRADVRTICFITKKGKDSAEKKQYASISEIGEVPLSAELMKSIIRFYCLHESHPPCDL